jgi:hypothetical protein
VSTQLQTIRPSTTPVRGGQRQVKREQLWKPLSRLVDSHSCILSALPWTSMPNLDRLTMHANAASYYPTIWRSEECSPLSPFIRAAASDLHESAVRGCTADKLGRRHNSFEMEGCRRLRPGQPTISADYQVKCRHSGPSTNR